MKLRGIVLALVLGCLSLVPAACAEVHEVTAAGARYGGGAELEGGLHAFYMTDGAAQEAAAQLLPQVGLRIQAKNLEALQIERRSYAGQVDAGSLGSFTPTTVADPTQDPNEAPQRTVLENAHLILTSQQAGLQLHIIPETLQDVVAFHGRSEVGQFTSLPSVAMTAGRFGESQVGDEDVRTPEAAEFWPIRVDEPVIVHDDLASQLNIQFRGDFVLEVMGATLEGQGRHRDVTLASGTWQEGLHPGLPEDSIHHLREVLVRIFLTDAIVDLDVNGGSPNLLWAASAASSTHDGDVTLQGATGAIDDQVLQADTYTLGQGTRLDFAPTESGMGLDVTTPTPSRASKLVAQAPAAYAGVMASLALAIALGLGAWRRWGQTPTLKHMEVAIEKGRFSRAARLAKRLLHIQPNSEDALLGRAIALSRHGRPAVAVAELEAHLGKRDASDGSLHYVLGTSYLDLGQVAEARVALTEAVRRTPSLQDSVADLLGHPVRRTEVNGYV